MCCDLRVCKVDIKEERRAVPRGSLAFSLIHDMVYYLHRKQAIKRIRPSLAANLSEREGGDKAEING